MQPIQTWKYEDGDFRQEIHLYEGKVYYSKRFNKDRFYEKELSLNEFFALKYPIISIAIDSQVYKKAVEQEKPSDLGEKESKRWDFWLAFDGENIKEEKIFFEEKRFWYKSKIGFAEGYIGYDDEVRLSEWQGIDNFFFYGPYFWGVPLADKKRIRQEIYDCLDKTKSNLTIDDSFVIFDYDKIEKFEEEIIAGITGSYIKIIGGKVIVGGWDNPRDGGANYTSVEYLWYNITSRVPFEFHEYLTRIRNLLRKAIINTKGEEKSEDLPPGKPQH